MKHEIKAAEIIQSNRETHKLIAEALLKYETLDSTQIKSLYETGKMPETVEEESHALSYDEVKSKMNDEKITQREARPLFFVQLRQ